MNEKQRVVKNRLRVLEHAKKNITHPTPNAIFPAVCYGVIPTSIGEFLSTPGLNCMALAFATIVDQKPTSMPSLKPLKE